MRTGTPHMRIFLDPRRFAYGDSQYAYRDQFLMCQRSFLESRVESEFLHASQWDQSPYAYGDQMNPNMHNMYGDCSHAIPVCIRGFKSIPVCIWRSQRSPYAYGEMGIAWHVIPVCIRGFVRSQYAYGDISVTNCMHTGNISIWEIKSCIPICVISHTGIAVCIWGSPYA